MTSGTQTELFSSAQGMDPDELVAYLNDRARRPVTVAITRNRMSMVSVRHMPSGEVKLRVHERFLEAPQEVINALRTYVRTRRRNAWRIVSLYAQSIPADKSRVAASALTSTGRVYDLKTIFDEMNRAFFSGRVRCRIGWGRARVRRNGRNRAKSIRFGSWNPTTGTIRVHPILDDPLVPASFVRYIVFHEMLHVVVPVAQRNGRRYSHSAEFRALEKSFPDMSEMRSISKKLLDRL